ncbi:MAG TPA: NAD-dependent epimerase/dehydratase family protein [Gemmatimonadaceae bacterium]|nr:NAD-dependent epimerase/dehydratase family protein [Gemmatimonadaceae bacterium]
MPRALVTGATGLVGSHVASRYLHDGWEVRALVRDPRAAAWLAATGTELVAGDLADPDAMQRAARACDVLVHAAALLTPRASWEAFHRANVVGTQHALLAAAASGARLVLVSSVAVYGARSRYRDGATDESVPATAGADDSYYARSKRAAEALVLEAHAEGRVWSTAVRPAVVYGARDRQFIPRAARILQRGIMLLPDGGRHTLAIVHAANVADGIVRAARTDAAGGQAYNLANDDEVTLARFVQLAALGLERAITTRSIAASVMTGAARAAALPVRLAGARELAGSLRTTATFLTRDNPFSSARAHRELGWTPPVHAADAIPDAFRWWRTHHGS